ncbi:MAG: hypothetical protein ACRENK_15560 [Gemmatimonadaceae bacterium]
MIKLNFDNIPDPWTIATGLVAAAAFGVRWLLRQWSKAKVDIEVDRADGRQVRRIDDATEHTIQRLEREVARQIERADREQDRAAAAFEERNQANQRAAEAVAKVGMLQEHVEKLERKVEALEMLLRGIYGKVPNG